mgnify:CR=1 FL=1
MGDSVKDASAMVSGAVSPLGLVKKVSYEEKEGYRFKVHIQ